MKKICSYSGCKEIVEDGNRCPQHPSTYSPTKKIYPHQYYNGKRIYNTTKWKKLRDWYIARHPICECEVCSVLGIARKADVVDHIKELSQGGAPFDPENLQSLSNSCHLRKTAQVAKEMRKKKALNGFKSLSDF